MDRIGSLPEEVLCHILSYLTTKEAALTSILSKRWRNLFTLVPHLDIDDSVFLIPEEGKRERDGILESFMDFVDRVLASQGDAPIKKFSLKCKTGIDTDRVNLWISNVLRRGVTSLELVLDFPRSDDGDLDFMYFLRNEMFVSAKLVELSLSSEFGVEWWRGRMGTFLPMLKTLRFESRVLLCDELDVFLSAFPVLEEFYVAKIEWSDWDESVTSDSLRKLTIFASGFEDFWDPKNISFDTPNLVYLEYSDFVAADYPKVNMPNLAEAVLDLKVTGHQMDLIREPDDEDDVSLLRLRNVWKLISGFRNVQRLIISAETLEVLSLCCESMPVFNNLKYLGIASDVGLGWQAMPVLLRNCPHLETLALKGLLHHVTDKCGDVCDCVPREDKGRSLLSCPVKKLEIGGFQGTLREKEMIRHFLESFPCLDEMEVYGDQNENDDPTDVEVNRIYKMVAFKVQGDEVNPETVLKSKSMSQTRMEEISAQFTPRNNKNMYDMVFMLHGAPPPPPPQEMSQDYLKEQLDADKTKLAKLHEFLKEQLQGTEAIAIFDRIIDQYPMIASALKARQSATDSEEAEASKDQEKKRDFEALYEIIVNPDFTSALRVRRGTDLERGETSRDQGEMTELDQTTSTAVVARDVD